MKKRVLAVILLIVVAAVVGSMTRSAEPLTGDASSDAQQSKEIRESYKLQPGAEVQVSGINGKVEIQTSDTDTAEIFIERNARNPEELNRRQIIIEHTETSLTVRGEKKNSGGFWSFLTNHGSASEHVMLKLPRKISLEAKGVNGQLNVGEVDGNVRVSGVNGKVELAQTSGFDEVSGVNGAVTIAVKQLGERGLRISGVNGRVELRLRDGLNADLQAKGMNGGVSSDMPEVSVQKDNNRNYSARIGNGGAPISLSGINGGVKLTHGTV
jgi:DUF4097 and DUF4098 domain-containing protein YvlB